MPSDTLLAERVASIEPQVQRLKTDVEELHEFKDAVIKELSELNSNVKTLSLKVGGMIGAVIFLLNFLSEWGAKIFLP